MASKKRKILELNRHRHRPSQKEIKETGRDDYIGETEDGEPVLDGETTLDPSDDIDVWYE